MRFIVYGAGGVGATIGARLHLNGEQVVMIARGEHGRVLAADGLRFVAPDGIRQLPITCVLHPSELEFSDDDVVLMTMKSQHTVGALEDLGKVATPGIALVSVQNGVANERMMLRRFAHVYGMVVWLPAVFLKAGEVITHACNPGGVLDIGSYPGGCDERGREIARRVTAAGFACDPDEAVMRHKYAKLLANLGNALQAAVAEGPGHRDLARLLRDEALACYAAAGIDCANRDETAARRGLMRFDDIEGYPRQGGSSWQSVMRGTGDIETDYLNGEIVQLGRLHGVPTPANALFQRLAYRMLADNLPAGNFTVAEVRAALGLAADSDG